MKKYKFLLLPLLVLIAIACSEGTNTSDGNQPTIPPVTTVNDVTWADIAFPEGFVMNDPDTALTDPTGNPTVADIVIYDNSSAKHKVTIIIKDSLPSGVFTATFGLVLNDEANFARHNSIPASASMAFALLPGVNGNNSATWVAKDISVANTGYFASVNHIGTKSDAYKALPADNKYTYRLDISTDDPFAKGEYTQESLTYAEAITKLPNTTKPSKPDFITVDQMVTLVTFTNPKKGYEIRVSDINDYAGFREYTKASWFTGGQYFGKSHPKGTALGLELGQINNAFGYAVPTNATDTTTSAWAFVDGNDYVSFIYHGSKSPNNPLPESDKNLFIIEVMQDDPMWFMPLADDNAK